MTKFLTEKEVRAFARSEWQKLREAEQARCSHARSGTLTDDGLVCDQCGKLIEPGANNTFDFGNEPLSSLERRHINQTWEES